MSAVKPVVLAILDGFGESPITEHNAIAQANTPALDSLKAQYPSGLINASELHVGLPAGQMGNSEVGHMNIGSGRVVMQDLPRIDQAVADGTLAKNPELIAFADKLKKSGGVCHLMGLVSPGGVHSHQAHMAALANMLTDMGITVKLHAFLDGRDTPPQSALEYLKQFHKAFSKKDFVTVSGRYYAMDRDKRWERVELAYNALVEGAKATAATSEKVVEASYAKKVTDEFVLPATTEDADTRSDYHGMKDGDAIFMTNFRADRAREILEALLDPEFKGFARRKVIKFAAALGMVEYSTKLNNFMASLFTPESLTNILGELISNKGMKQLHIAETEKYAHVTFFFNGGREEPFPGEERILVPSPRVATYDLQPEMSAGEVTDKLVCAIESGKFDFIVVNYANCDMVGHTGNIEATIKAVEAVDTGIGRVWAAIEKMNGALIVSADHGNAEQMHDDHTHQAHTAHTLNLVPAIIAAKHLKGQKPKMREGKLADLAPTVLQLMNIAQPKEMTGRSLLV